MSITKTVVPEWAAGFTSLIFYRPDGNAVAALRTGDLDLVPTAPLMVEPFNEKLRTLDAAPWHGTIEYSPLQARVFENASGTWEFVYEPDGQSHSYWDCYVRIDIPRENDRWMVTPSTWTSAYHSLLHFLQGKRVEVDVPDGKGKMTRYKGRCWVNSYTADQSGQIKVSIGYNLTVHE